MNQEKRVTGDAKAQANSKYGKNARPEPTPPAPDAKEPAPEVTETPATEAKEPAEVVETPAVDAKESAEVTETSATDAKEPVPATAAAATDDKGPSVLEKLHKAWEAAGKNKPAPAESVRLRKEYETKLAKQRALEKELEEATKAADAVAYEIVQKHGRKVKMPIGGVLHVAACYGQKVYFKKIAQVELDTIGVE